MQERQTPGQLIMEKIQSSPDPWELVERINKLIDDGNLSESEKRRLKERLFDLFCLTQEPASDLSLPKAHPQNIPSSAKLKKERKKAGLNSLGPQERKRYQNISRLRRTIINTRRDGRPKIIQQRKKH